MGRKRHPTQHTGVFYRMVPRIGHEGQEERMYYGCWTERGGRVREAKIGRGTTDGITPAQANQIRAEYASGKRLPPQAVRMKREADERAAANRPTFTRLWEIYKADHEELKGLVTDDNRFKLHIEPTIGQKTPVELVPLDVDRIRKKLEKDGRAAATIKNTLELVRRLANYAERKQLCAPMPFRIGSKKVGAAVQMPTPNNERTEFATETQIKALLVACDEFEDQDVASVVKLALLTGMRRGELVRLRHGDVDERSGFVTIRDPKGGRDQTIPMNAGALAVIGDQKRRHPESPWVFPAQSARAEGGHLHPDTATSKAREILKAAGLGDSGFRPLHGLRHTFASSLASSGQVDMYVLQKLMTHKSPAMTQRYAHLRDDALKGASNVIDGIVTQATAKSKPGRRTKNLRKKRGAG